MFQSPLYYLIAALPYHFAALPPADTPKALPRALLLIPLVCGAIQIQLAYVATRRVFPGREDLQALGTLVAGFLPINLYASQHIGNEPLAGVLSAGSLVVALGLLAPAAPAGRRRDWALLGTLVGFAMLTKSTAGLLVPPLIFTLAWKLWREDRDVRQLAASLGLVLVTAFSVCGWYYVRNWIELGSPFLVGTEASRGIHWWQEPGYRTPRDFFAFGAALEQPLYASVHGFWNGLYASLWSDGHYSGRIPAPQSVKPWNEEFLIAGALLGLVPSLALLIGVARSMRRLQTALLSLCLLTLVAAMLYLFLRVPHYSAVKATYTLGLLPAYAVLAASGFEPLIRRPAARSVIVGALACGAMAAYRAYFAASA
jgi:4-amino-4-deoxy-L-arabinose transferase-like glycosyltransferase